MLKRFTKYVTQSVATILHEKSGNETIFITAKNERLLKESNLQ